MLTALSYNKVVIIY